METRVLGAEDAERVRVLRLDALRDSPTAFSSSEEEERDIPVAQVAERLAPTPDGAVFGAFEDGALVGMAGLHRERHRKLAHKGVLWGVYVKPAFRRRGLARRLLEEALRYAASMPGLRQVNLGANAASPAALALYEALGFERFGFERGFMAIDGVLYDEVHMTRLVTKR